MTEMKFFEIAHRVNGRIETFVVEAEASYPAYACACESGLLDFRNFYGIREVQSPFYFQLVCTVPAGYIPFKEG